MKSHYPLTLLFRPPALCLILLLTTSLFHFDTAQAQSRRGITIEEGTYTLEEIFQSIEKQSCYTFAYNSNNVYTQAKMKVAFKGLSVGNALKAIFSNTRYKYKIVGRHITVTPKEDIKLITRLPQPKYTYWEPVRPRAPLSYQAPEINPNLGLFPKAVVKTNALSLLTTTLNFGVEFAAGPRWTIDTRIGCNPWSFGSDGKIRHFSLQAGSRYWFDRAFNGWFAGIDAAYYNYEIGRFNLDVIKNFRDRVYDGYAVGGGLTAGYRLQINPKWGIEFTVGAQLLRTKYDKCLCKNTPTVKEYPLSLHETLIIPKMGISFTYRIK